MNVKIQSIFFQSITQKKTNNKNNPEQLLATFYGFQVITFKKMNGIDLSIYICWDIGICHL